MTYQLVTEPIDHWPVPDTAERVFPPFTATYSSTLSLLHRELTQIDATGPVVLQVVTRRGAADLRRDGMIRADAKIEHPGARLSFECRHGHLTYATDWIRDWGNRPGWQMNLRAIALGLEALRKVDRYGIAQSGEQYRGWLQIEGAGPDLERARAVIYMWAEADDLSERDAFRSARARTHPDRNDGDRTAWDQVEAAAKLLGILS